MTHTPSATETLDREFLTIRGKLLEVAAALDRIDGGPGPAPADARLEKIRRTLAMMGEPPSELKRGRAEQLQMIFSLPYEADWRGI